MFQAGAAIRTTTVIIALMTSWSTSTECASDDRGIRRTERLSVEGARLYVEVRGRDRQQPALVWLHGGPGAPERPLFRYFNGDLERRFTVVYWDQRGAARSYDPKADAEALTVARHVQDLDAVVQHIERMLGQRRVFLIGHSWGGTLGLLYAYAHPERVRAVVAVSPEVSVQESQRRQYDFVSREAAARGDQQALTRLQRLGQPPHATAEAVLDVEALADRYGAVFHRRPHKLWILFSGTLRGLARPWELPRFFHANSVSLQAMNRELLALDLRERVPRLEVPVVFMLGRYDRHVDADVAARYYEQLAASQKALVWFEQSAHNAPFEESAAFNAAVATQLLRDAAK